MSKVNRGKQFEEQVKSSFEKQDNVSILRLIDPQNGYAGVRNPCDFIVYKYPNLCYLECKSCYGNTLPFSNITDTQWYSLWQLSRIKGVRSGYLIWFIDHDTTVYVSANTMWQLERDGKKSFHIKDAGKYDSYIVPSKKLRVLCEYDMTNFFEEIK